MWKSLRSTHSVFVISSIYLIFWYCIIIIILISQRVAYTIAFKGSVFKKKIISKEIYGTKIVVNGADIGLLYISEI